VTVAVQWILLVVLMIGVLILAVRLLAVLGDKVTGRANRGHNSDAA
jgi:hypothetical protein